MADLGPRTVTCEAANKEFDVWRMWTHGKGEGNCGLQMPSMSLYPEDGHLWFSGNSFGLGELAEGLEVD